MKKLLCLLGGAMLFINAFGQRPAFESGKVYVNSVLPNINMGSFIKYKDSTANLDDFFNKIIILDFWFTGCSQCISNFPLEDSLQNIFKDDIQIIPVTFQSKEIVSNFLKKWEQVHKKKLSMPFIVGDILLNTIFYDRSNPHYVWISQDKRVIGHTSSDLLSFESIKSVIKSTQDTKEAIRKSPDYVNKRVSIDINKLYNYYKINNKPE